MSAAAVADPVTIEVVASRLREVARTMEHALFHSGFSPILRESRDGTAGLTDRNGRVLMVGGGLQFHSLPYETAVRAVLARFPREIMRLGDSYLVNDPYIAGNPHVPDFVVVTPAFHAGNIVGFGVSIAHKADVGGLVPGSSSANSRSIFHDGLRLPPVRLESAGRRNEAVEDIIRNNSRAPDVVIGDLNGQIGATRLGAERLAGLCDEYGREIILCVMDELLALTARRLHAELAAIPDGEAEATGLLDDDGAVRDKPVPITVKATKSGDRLTLDFSASSSQVEGPINVAPSTAKAVSLLAVVAALDPTIPLNSGLNEPVTFVLPDGSLVNPRSPASISSYFPTAVMVYTVVLSALGKLNPARAVAPSGMATGAMALGYHGRNGADQRVQYELASTALGGNSRGDGAAILHPMNHFTAGSPIEIIESEYPILVRRFEYWPDSAGAGRHRGGVGVRKEYEVLEDALLTLRTTLHRQCSWGLAGGLPPRTSETRLDPDTRREVRLTSLETRSIAAGTVIRVDRSGGGGFGPAWERDPQAVLEDVLDGLVTREAAATVYGVVLDETGKTVDSDATQARRRSLADG